MIAGRVPRGFASLPLSAEDERPTIRSWPSGSRRGGARQRFSKGDQGQVLSESYFSTNFAEARRRFQAAAQAVGAAIHSYGIDGNPQGELALDVAILGEQHAPTVVVTSGVHGVEGFLGSAVQLAFLDRLRQSGVASNLRHVLIHGINPFGFSRLRRFNEDNIDLNRNFLANPSEYHGAPQGYARLNGFLNPESPPSRFEPVKLKALWTIWRNGLQALTQAVAGGQYEYPRGIFFGGRGPGKSTELIRDHCDAWFGASQKMVHIDFHSGLGAFGTYKLLVNQGDSSSLSWYTDAFGSDCVEAEDAPGETAYRATGLFGEWMQAHFASRAYRFVTAEFGTYPVIRVLAAIRAENRAHHYGDERSAIYQAAKAELLECFCPKDNAWRKQVVEAGVKIVTQGVRAIGSSP